MLPGAVDEPFLQMFPLFDIIRWKITVVEMREPIDLAWQRVACAIDTPGRLVDVKIGCLVVGGICDGYGRLRRLVVAFAPVLSTPADEEAAIGEFDGHCGDSQSLSVVGW